MAYRIAGTGALILIACAGLAFGWLAAGAAAGAVLVLFGLALLARVPV